MSSKAFGSVKSFAANTNVGTVRKANEDRISIILNVIQPSIKTPRVPNETPYVHRNTNASDSPRVVSIDNVGHDSLESQGVEIGIVLSI